MSAFRRVELSATPVVTASAAYSSGNTIGGLLTFSGKGLSEKMLLEKVIIIDKANQKSAVDLLLFSKSFTATADKNAVNISASDSDFLQCHLNLVSADWATIGTSLASATKVFSGGVGIISAAEDDKIYGQLVSRGTPTFGSTADIVVRLGLQVWIE